MGTYVVNTDVLNRRSSPGGAVLGTVKRGTILNIVSQTSGWLVDDQDNFYSAAYCRAIALSPTRKTDATTDKTNP